MKIFVLIKTTTNPKPHRILIDKKASFEALLENCSKVLKDEISEIYDEIGNRILKLEGIRHGNLITCVQKGQRYTPVPKIQCEHELGIDMLGGLIKVYYAMEKERKEKEEQERKKALESKLAVEDEALSTLVASYPKISFRPAKSK